MAALLVEHPLVSALAAAGVAFAIAAVAIFWPDVMWRPRRRRRGARFLYGRGR